MTSPVDNLLRLQRLAEQTGDDSLAAWLADGLDAYLFANLPLEQALDLHADGPGKRTARCLYLLHQRDAALRAAWALCDGTTPWQRSVTLAREINRFLAILWPRWHDLDQPPEQASDLRRYLFTARRCGDLPTTARQCHRIAVSMSGTAA